MALPERIIDFLNQSAEREGVEQPGPHDNLFILGVLDSFTLVDLVTLLEEQCGIKISDSDVTPNNFQNIEVIEQYIKSHKA